MGQKQSKDNSAQVTVAIIGCFGVIAAAVIGGIFLLATTLLDRDQDGTASASTVIVVFPTDDNNGQNAAGSQDAAMEDFATAAMAENIGISPSDIRQAESLPANITCPDSATAGWLNTPYYWYGPYVDASGFSYFIGHDTVQIHVWDPFLGMQSWDDPQLTGRRNQWLTLTGTPFTICVDTVGNVFADFSP